MLHYLSFLSVEKTLTKESFIRLVLKWIKESPYASPMMKNAKWNGKYSYVVGDELESLEIHEYKQILAVRFRKPGHKGLLWEIELILNLDEWKLAVCLYSDGGHDIRARAPKFTVPDIIPILSRKGYLASDGDLPVSQEPILLTRNNYRLLSNLIHGTAAYQLPVIYVSRMFTGEEPINTKRLAARLAGIAHVVVQGSASNNKLLRKCCDGKNEYNGAIGVYYPNSTGHRRFMDRPPHDRNYTEAFIRRIFLYTNSRKLGDLYTWQGVKNALLQEEIQRREETVARAEAQRQKILNDFRDFQRKVNDEQAAIKESAMDEAKAEANRILESFDEDMERLQSKIESLTKANHILEMENQLLKEKSNDSKPVLYLAYEEEYFPGEVKEMVLAAVSESLKEALEGSRRYDLLQDILKCNNYQNLRDNAAGQLKAILKDYKKMDPKSRQALEDLGFVITEEGKHYKLDYYGKGRYIATLAKSPSDRRCGKNNISILLNGMF